MCVIRWEIKIFSAAGNYRIVDSLQRCRSAHAHRGVAVCGRRRLSVINPRLAYAARVTVLGSVCLCVSVCVFCHISPMEGLFVLKTLLPTQWEMKVKIFVGICLKRLAVEHQYSFGLCKNEKTVFKRDPAA